jgi:hypothetical protein
MRLSTLCLISVCCLVFLSIISAKAENVLGNVYVEYGSNLGSTVPTRINYLLSKAGIVCNSYSENVDADLSASSLVLSFGNASLSNKFMNIDDVNAEGFRFLSQEYISQSTLITSNGKPLDLKGKSSALNLDAVHYGAVLGAYAVLEKLGFGFLHPMDPIVPTGLNFPLSAPLSNTESPYWPTRTWHIHTQHPLEFTDVLNGFDIPMFAEPDSSNSSSHSTSTSTSTSSQHSCLPHQHCETWDSMFSTLDGLFEWLAANRQNRVEVLLLGSPKWDVYGNLTSGPQRQSRLQQINQLAHSYGVLIGADIPIANRQQHGWKMISLQDSFEQQTVDIQARVDWAFAADYDFISTESGLSEFTKPSCDLMLNLFEVFTERGIVVVVVVVCTALYLILMCCAICKFSCFCVSSICKIRVFSFSFHVNMFVVSTAEVATHWNREAVTKVHCSTSQFCNEKVRMEFCVLYLVHF